jgi:hypothetical protein
MCKGKEGDKGEKQQNFKRHGIGAGGVVQGYTASLACRFETLG